MPDLSAYTTYTVRIDNTGSVPLLILTDTGSYPSPASTSRQGYFTITTPDGIVRNYDPNTPDITQANLGFTYPLPLATDGTLQKDGLYKITLKMVASTFSDTFVTHNFTLSLTDIKPVIAPTVDFNTPEFKYEDKTVYSQTGYNTPAVSRLWTADSGRGPFTSTGSFFYLSQASNYYNSKYSVSLDATATYQHRTLAWLSVVTKYTSADTLDKPILPKWDTLVSWAKAYDEGKDGCGCGDKINPESSYIWTRLTAIQALACLKDYTCMSDRVAQLYSLTHSGQAYKLTHTNEVIAPGTNSLCNCGCDDAACGAAATVLTFDTLTGTSAKIHYTAPSGQLYDLVLYLPNGDGLPYLNVASGQIITGLQAGTVYVPKLTTRCATGSPFSITADSFTTTNSLRVVTQPLTQTVADGTSVSVSVAVTGGETPYSYQWQYSTDGGANYNDSLGATSASYTLGIVTTSSSGRLYRCVITDNASASVASNAAIITITGSYAFRIGYATEDPFVNSGSAPAGVTYPTIMSGTIGSAGADITLLHTLLAFTLLADAFIVLEIDTAITNRGHAINGTDYIIPTQEFSRSAAAAGKKYIVSNNPWGLTTTENFVFTV